MTKYEIIHSIKAELSRYETAYNETMRNVRRTDYATDIATLASMASRQLAAMQALEHVLLKIETADAADDLLEAADTLPLECPIARAMTT